MGGHRRRLVGKGDDRAQEFAEQQRNATARWFLRPAAGLDELEERLREEREAEVAERDARFAEVRRIFVDNLF